MEVLKEYFCKKIKKSFLIFIQSKMSESVVIHEDSKSVIELNHVTPTNEPIQTNEINQTEVSEFAKLVSDLTQTLKSGFENFEIDENNIIDYIVRVMAIVEKQKQLSGIEKKAVAIEILLRLVDSYDRLNIESKSRVKLLVKTLAPSVIDTIVSATKGALSVNKKVEEASRKCFARCC